MLEREVGMNRWPDWWAQAERDLAHGEHALEDGDFEWSAFAAQQAGEKAIKALILSRGGEPWGHSLTALTSVVPPDLRVGPDVVEAAKRLDKHYIPTRYPNGFAAGHPGALYVRSEAEGALDDARLVLAFCRSHLPGP
jgi:HEPN domain-containing protein